MRPHHGLRTILILLAFTMLSRPVSAAITIQAFSPSLSSPQPVGTTITWLAIAADSSAGALDFRFSVGRADTPGFSIVRDFHPAPAFQWTESGAEGVFQIEVTARNKTTGEVAVVVEPFVVTSRVAGNLPVVNSTTHPLVALYSAPPCPAGSTMRVKFRRSGDPAPTSTSAKPCDATTSMNFYLAGMLAETTYSVQHDIDTGGVVTQGPLLQFVSGIIPSHLQFPTTALAGAPSGQTSFVEKVVLHDYMSGFPVATDLPGRVLWYYEPAARVLQTNRYFVRPLGGGFLIHMNDPTIPDLLLHKGQVIREIDLAGNTLRETNVTRVSEQLLQLGWSQGLTSFHHDAIRLPNGHTLTIASMEKMFPPGTQGSATSIDILGDAVIDLDENFQVVWAWSSYDQLDVNRGAVLGEVCNIERPLGCPPFVLAPTANDWLHSNSLNYVPSTGDFLISMRHQDWVLRIDYDNGTGTGAVVWRLGKDGDFTIDSSDAYPWFSHQHDAGFELDGTALLSIYDNGNTRVAQTRGSSRGQVYAIDETAMTARLLLNADLGVYAPAVGNGHRLANGNYHFGSGLLPSGSGIISHATEVLATGVRNYILRSDSRTYRSYRLQDLYTAPNK